MDLISKQKKYLSENLIVESLRMYDSNQEDIKEFFQATRGNTISEYLNTKAWDDDYNNVFLSSFSLTFFVLRISPFLNMFKNILSFKEESIYL